MVENEKTQFANGMFSVSTTQKLTGSLSLNGEETTLHLWGDKIENIDALDGATITGILENQKKASLIDCIVTRQERFFGKDGVFHHYRLFPHYVVIGTRHRSSSEKTITKISFVIDDAMALFHDRYAFGTVDIPPDRVKDIASMDLFEKSNLKMTIRSWPIGLARCRYFLPIRRSERFQRAINRASIWAVHMEHVYPTVLSSLLSSRKLGVSGIRMSRFARCCDFFIPSWVAPRT